eukprot:286331-Prymnesium_polylepis.1
MLEKHDFSVVEVNPDTGEEGVYVPLAKRRRIIQTDETHQVMSTQLESGGPRAHVYVDTTHGAFARATVTNQRHTTG